MSRRLLVGLTLTACVALQAPAGLQPAAPPNGPAEVRIDGASIRVSYNGGTIFEGRVENPDALRQAPIVGEARVGDAVHQTIALHGRGAPLRLSGIVTTSSQGFPAASDRPVRQTPIVRHSSGLGWSRLNQSVYDRQWDWVLSVDDHPRTRARVVPASESGALRTFRLDAESTEIVLRFRPRFYQRHRGLRFFEPWTYQIWRRPVVGWCSWFAFFDKVTEQDIRRTADVMAETLVPWGYEYLQIDDGYQRATGLPELWLQPNEKFPAGLDALAAAIRQRSLEPGIWTNATFSQTAWAEQHPLLFVRDRNGRPAKGNWIDHPVDASNPEALDTLVRPIYRALKRMGWSYFKLDALRHLRYEGYNSYRDHFASGGADVNQVLRRYVQAVRDEIGRDSFLLACWGIRPELVGLVDGCRLGTDGFSFAGLAQFNSFNNVVWRNDPDHIELSEREAWRSTTVTSLTGSLFMLTDRPETYRTSLVEPARRAAPVLVTVPGQLYDVDPSRSSEIWRVDGEVSGRDPKPFDAGLTPGVHLYLLEVNRPFERWVVLGRTGGSFDEIRFEELGLDPERPYLVFEFWQKSFLGSHRGAFVPGPLPAALKTQVFVIREQFPHPQLVSTTRHLTGGGVDLVSMTWDGSALSGSSRTVAGEPIGLYVTEPAGWRLVEAACDRGGALAISRAGGVAQAGCGAAAAGVTGWRLRYTTEAAPSSASAGRLPR